MDITAGPFFEEILGSFSMIKNFCAWLKSSRQEKNFDSEVQVFFVHSKKLVKTISFLEETPEANVSHDLLSLLSDKLNSDLSLYNDFAVKIKNKAPLKNFVEKL